MIGVDICEVAVKKAVENAEAVDLGLKNAFGIEEQIPSSNKLVMELTP